MLGTLRKQQGRLDEAVAGFRETIRHNPSSAEAHLSLGQVLQQKKDAAGAAAAFAEADRLSKKKADVQAAAFAISAGREKLAQGDVEAALARLREAVRLAPMTPRRITSSPSLSGGRAPRPTRGLTSIRHGGSLRGWRRRARSHRRPMEER